MRMSANQRCMDTGAPFLQVVKGLKGAQNNFT
jgi:hypothetical protein